MSQECGKYVKGVLHQIVLNNKPLRKWELGFHYEPKTISLPKIEAPKLQHFKSFQQNITKIPQQPKKQDHKILKTSYKAKISSLTKLSLGWMTLYSIYMFLDNGGVWGSQNDTKFIVEVLQDIFELVLPPKNTKSISERWNDFVWTIGTVCSSNNNIIHKDNFVKENVLKNHNHHEEKITNNL